MKILFLANASSIHTVRWVNALSDRNHEVHLIYIKGDEPSANKISNKVILHELNYSGNKGYFLNRFQLTRKYKEIQPDIVNAHYASGYGILARLSKLKPMVLSVWGSDVYDFPYQSAIKKNLVSKNLLYADAIASTSYCMSEQVKEIVNLKNKKIHITPFGVDIEKFKPFKKINKKSTDILIGNIKTLAPVYGIDILIKSVKMLLDNLNEKNLKEVADKVKLLIYGEGKQKDELQSLIVELNMEEHIFLKGSIPNNEVPKALEELDIFCVTSLTESFGVAVVEAMAMELPIVATNADGFKEVINHGETGILVEKNDLQALSRALEKLILDKNLRIEMGLKGRERVLQLYNWENNVNEMELLYRQYGL